MHYEIIKCEILWLRKYLEYVISCFYSVHSQEIVIVSILICWQCKLGVEFIIRLNWVFSIVINFTKLSYSMDEKECKAQTLKQLFDLFIRLTVTIYNRVTLSYMRWDIFSLLGICVSILNSKLIILLILLRTQPIFSLSFDILV